MPIDRETSLRRAEKLLRQGRLDAAIEEYRRIIDEQPSDWNTANLLGDLYARAGHIERATEQFNRVADHLAQEGFFPKAAALYRKVLKIAPENDHALLQSAEMASRQGLLADARAALTAVAEHRRRRGDRRGAAEVTLRLSALDPADPALALQAARAAAELEDRAGALLRFRETAASLASRGRTAESVGALLEAVDLEPADAPTRGALVAALLTAGDVDQARQHAVDAAQLKAVASALSDAGREEDSQAVLEQALRLVPGDGETRVRLLRLLIARRRWTDVRDHLPPDAASDPVLAAIAAEAEVRAGQRAEGRAIVDCALASGALSDDGVVQLAAALAASDVDGAFSCIEAVTARAVHGHDWPRAAEALRRFLGHAPGHILALSRLVEIAVDGDLEAYLSTAQADLADAYLASGHAEEARVIAEDLVTREPWVRVHTERLRRILAGLGEENPDQVIADRLSAESLFGDPFAEFLEDAPPQRASGPEGDAGSVESAATAGASPPVTPPSARAADLTPVAGQDVYRLGPEAIDLEAILGPNGMTDDPQPVENDAVEIDLSDVLGGPPPFSGSAAVPAGFEPDASAPAQQAPGELDAAFEDFRQEVVRDRTTDAAAQYYKLGVMYHDTGLLDDAVKALHLAARAPRHRFEASALLARIRRQQGQLDEAIEWFERAAEAPAASASAAHALLYDLADVLEQSGERARALAVLLELQTDAGSFRDVAARIERLSRA